MILLRKEWWYTWCNFKVELCLFHLLVCMCYTSSGYRSLQDNRAPKSREMGPSENRIFALMQKKEIVDKTLESKRKKHAERMWGCATRRFHAQKKREMVCVAAPLAWTWHIVMWHTFLHVHFNSLLSTWKVSGPCCKLVMCVGLGQPGKPTQRTKKMLARRSRYELSRKNSDLWRKGEGSTSC